jgi:hypothetical protein
MGVFIFGFVFDQLEFLRPMVTCYALRVDGSEAENAHDVTRNLQPATEISAKL